MNVPSRLRVLLVSLVVPMALASCATVKRARAVQNPASAVPGERTPTVAELGLPKEGRVALELLVRTALRVHPSVVGARHKAEAAFARVRAAEGTLLPEVSISGGAAYRDGTASTEHRFASYGFDVSWLIFDFGRRSAFIREAGQQWLAAQEDLRMTEVNVAFAVRLAYFELAKNIELLATAKETVAQYETRLAQVTELERVGKRIAYDVTKASVDLGNAKLSEVQAVDGILTSQAGLASFVGLAEVVGWVADAPDAKGVQRPDLAVPGAFDAAWAATLPSRPSLAAAAARERAASAFVDAQVAALYPSVSVDLGLGGSGSQSPLPWSFNLGPNVRWTPFDGFQNLASIDESVAVLREARTARTKEEQLAWLELRTAWIAIEDAEKRLELTELLVRSAEENYGLAQGRFDAGLGTSVDLSDASQALVTARTDRIQARADRAIAFARLAQAIGLTAPRP